MVEVVLKRMGFTFHPGPLPIMTVRHSKWANRLWVGEIIEIHGEHGCNMPEIAAEVKRIEPFNGQCPAHLANVYAGQKLVVIALVAPKDVWRKTGETWVKIDAV